MHPKLVLTSRDWHTSIQYHCFRTPRDLRQWASTCDILRPESKRHVPSDTAGLFVRTECTYDDEPGVTYTCFHILFSGSGLMRITFLVHESTHAAEAMCRLHRSRKEIPPNCPPGEFRAYAASALVSAGLVWIARGLKDPRGRVKAYANALRPIEYCLDPDNWK
jgi:hypothetical protein